MRRVLCVLGLAAVAMAGLSAPASAAYLHPCRQGVGVEAGSGSPLGGPGVHVMVCL